MRFKVKGEENVSLLAWTTTPWTLPSNVALAVSADYDYAYVERDGGETLILAKDLVESRVKGDYRIVRVVKGPSLWAWNTCLFIRMRILKRLPTWL